MYAEEEKQSRSNTFEETFLFFYLNRKKQILLPIGVFFFPFFNQYFRLPPFFRNQNNHADHTGHCDRVQDDMSKKDHEIDR